MADQLDKGTRILTMVLLGIVLFQLSSSILRKDPLARLQVPTAPRWEAVTSTNSGPAGKATVSLPAAKPIEGGTNSVATNGAASTGIVGSSNRASEGKPLVGPTNSPAKTGATNLAANGSVTNTRPSGPIPRPAPGMMPGTMPGMAGRGGGKPLSASLQSRVERITQSEILAPIIRPPPMALLGIAGRDAFLRTPSGQTQILREGAELDGVRLLRIGTNRVLVEHAGEKKELMIFAGFGGESLLPK